MEFVTKTDIISALLDIKARGWIPNRRPGNDGGVGNTLEDLLGITENNLPIANADRWELKCQRESTSSLTTLFHIEPSPREAKLVPNILLPKYGWRHEEAGRRYPETEMSFRQTINATSRTDRGFGVVVRREERKIVVSFDYREVDSRHEAWLEDVRRRVGLGELSPQP